MQSNYANYSTGGVLAVSQAAVQLGVHVDTLRRWAKAGKVSCFRTPSGHRRFLQTDIDAIKADGALAGSDDTSDAVSS